MNTHPAAKRSSMAPAPRPIIEGLTPYDEVDLDKLGAADLVLSITYDNIGVGQTIVLEWVGADGNGVDSSFSGRVDIDSSNFDPNTGLARIAVSNAYIVNAANGYAFAAFTPTVPPLPASLRAFCFVGVRPRRLEHMPVAQAPQSHNLFIDPGSLGSAGATFLVPAYEAMQKKDKVTLTFVGFESSGALDETWSRPIEVTAQDVGQVLRWDVPSGQFDFIGGGHAEVHYEIAFADQTASLTSPTQTFRIGTVPTTPPLLPHLEIEDYSSGLLDPTLFPNGLVLRVPANAELMVSDWVLLNFNGVLGEQQLRIDLSCLESGVIAFKLAAEKLQGLDRITLGYQVAREGVAYSATARQVDLVVRREDAPLNVLHAESEGGDEAFNARLSAIRALSGASIDLSGIELATSETLEVYWEGRSTLGKHKSVFSDVPKEPLTIPPAAVAANMEAGDTGTAKRFPVYYRILPVGHESKKLHLRILPLPMSRYPTLQCEPRRGSEIHLADVVGDHAVLTLSNWPFMSEKQRLVIILEGIVSGAATFYEMCDLLITQDHVSEGFVSAPLAKTTLQALDNNTPLVFKVSVNFEGAEGGDTWTQFPQLSLTLRK